ncbi:metallophosphoesterase [Hydrocarboniphaga effusa]|uniref:metallophosphoesterase n=1 Tax=Hydrocarboniphaga effusa TaxID=243629 RepID=UPI003BAC7E81
MNKRPIGNVLVLNERALPSGGRFLIVGDIHGELEMLERVLVAAQYDESRDILISAGDLIDRGPSSAEVVKFFVDHPRRLAILGNHEGYPLEASGIPHLSMNWMAEGGAWALLETPDDLQRMVAALKQFPLGMELILENSNRRVGIVHGEVPVGSSWDDLYRLDLDRDDMTGIMFSEARAWLSGRHRIKAAALAHSWREHPDVSSLFDDDEMKTSGIDLVISGHSIMPHRRPYRSGNQLWIDTGAFEHKRGGRLTVIDPVEQVYWQTSANESFGPLSLNDPWIWSLNGR